ncbi:MAG: hypothetical protein ABWY06_12260 [Pseudomonas sp.]|uniref:hypothetical protein n=1 Tax=Pseudomonas sp. TaxID=306 RepID=UPI003390BCFB
MTYPFGSTLKPGSAPTAVATPSAELEAYFRQPVDPANVDRHDLELNLLTREQSAELTLAILDEPIIAMLGGIVLDDGNTSNHHVYLTQAPLSGSILYWQHDDSAYIAFADLPAFLEAVEQAKKEECWLTDLHVHPYPVLEDQAGLRQFIHAMLDEDTEEHFKIADTLIPALALTDLDLLARLVNHPYYFFAESVASAIRDRPDPALTALARQCSEHSNYQVRWAGDSALAAIQERAENGTAVDE